MRKVITLSLLFFLLDSLLAQTLNLNHGNIKEKEYFQKIPYVNIKGKLVIPVTIKGKTYNFLFDTGAPLSISHKLFLEINPEIIGQKEVVDASGNKRVMKGCMLEELSVQGITFVNTFGCVLHEESSDYFDVFECMGIEGIIGSNMLRNSVVQIDGQNKHIIITDNMKNLSMNYSQKQRMRLTTVQSNPFIKVEIKNGKRKAGDFFTLFDTGDEPIYTMSTIIYDQVKNRSEVVEKISEGNGSFDWGVHGTADDQQYLLLNVPELVINNQSFNNLVTNTTNSRFSRVGSKLIEYGVVTLDYKKKYFYFSPHKNANFNEISKRLWSIQPIFKNEKIVVGIIWDKSLEFQINLGDEILSVNGIDYQSKSLCEFALEGFGMALEEITDNEKLIVILKDKNTEEIKTIEIKRM